MSASADTLAAMPTALGAFRPKIRVNGLVISTVTPTAIYCNLLFIAAGILSYFPCAHPLYCL